MTTHHWHHYAEDERRKWQDPEMILKAAGVQPGITFIDIGCGQGFFTLPAARIIGSAGKIFGVDTDESAIGELGKKAEQEGIKNLQLTVSPAEKALLCEACADIVFLGIVLHDFADPARVLSNAHRMLKPGGKLVNLDWKKEPMEYGPPLKIRFDEATATRLIESAGFKIIATTNSGKFHYVITASPR